jgi:hypothetical protein
MTPDLRLAALIIVTTPRLSAAATLFSRHSRGAGGGAHLTCSTGQD